MKYRYFYNSQGHIVGFTQYKVVCYAEGVADSTGYIDSDNQINIANYEVDLTTQTLVAKSQ